MAKQICFSCLYKNRLCSWASPALQMPYSLQGKTVFLGDELPLEIQPQLCTVLPAAQPCLLCAMTTVTHPSPNREAN